ncbi:hypothetical protein EON80_18570 [bacterium]|nr:MAG: hypothetical protein EON80_18570 [bacterium]
MKSGKRWLRAGLRLSVLSRLWLGWGAADF